jgi:hypothetical protein
MLLAFYYEIDDGAEIFFAESEQEAQNYAEKLGVGGLKRVECFDKYAPGPISDAERYAEEWPVNCWYCDHRLDDDYCDHCEGHHEEIVVYKHGVFCNQQCLDDHKEAKARIKLKKEKAVERLLKKVPFVTIGSICIGGLGSCKNKCWNKDSENVYIDLHFEGEKYNHSRYCDGCGKIWIAGGDLEAWNYISVQPSLVVNCTKK